MSYRRSEDEIADKPLSPGQRELLDDATRDACRLTGQTISLAAVQLAAEIANAVERETGVKSDVPHATLFHICEMAVRLEGKPALDIAGAMVALTKKLLDVHATKLLDVHATKLLDVNAPPTKRPKWNR